MTANPTDDFKDKLAARGIGAKPKPPAAVPPLTAVVPTAPTPPIPTRVPGELTEEQVAMAALLSGEVVVEAPEVQVEAEAEQTAKRPTTIERILTDRGFAAEVQRQLLQRDAREAVAEIEARRNPAPPFDAGLMRDIEDDTDTQWRIEGLLAEGSRVLLIAQRKAGKTTMGLNLAYSAIVGTPFLGRFPVAPITGRVAILNYEVTGGQLKRWAREVGIPEDRLFLVNLRDRRNPLSHPGDRAELIALLRAHDVELLIVDPFSRAFDGESENDNTAVNRWLGDLSMFTSEAGASELVLIAHAGWSADGRVRGASGMEGWTDGNLRLTVRDDGAERFFSADGRDVEVAKERLTFDPVTRHLSLSGDVAPSRAQMAESHLERVGVAVLAYLKELRPEGQGVRQIEAGMRTANEEAKKAGRPYVSFRKGEVTKALKPFREKGWVAVEKVGATDVHTYVGPEEMSS